MRPFSSLPIAAALSLATLAGCARSAPRGCGPTCAVVLLRADVDALVPGVTQSSDGIAISDLLFLKLADMGPGLNTMGDSGFEPRLARAWHFEDPRTIVFQLDPRARWQDGTPVTADDVVFSFRLFQDSAFGAPQRSSLERVAQVTARDSLTVAVRFRTAYPEEFYDATYQVGVLPKHLLDTIPPERIGTHPFVRHPVGDGPYRFVSWQAGQSIELAADTAFFLGRPAITRLLWRVTPDPTVQVAQIEAGEADVVEVLPDPALVAQVRASSTARAVEYRGPTYIYIGFNLRDPANLSRPHPVLGDRTVRQAIVLAVNRTAVVQTVLKGLAAVPPGPVSRMEWIWGDEDTVSAASGDTARADALLDRAGWRRGPDGVRVMGGKKLTFALIVPATSRLRNNAAELVQDQLKRIGVDMTIEALESNAWQDRARKGKFDALFGAWNTDPTPASVSQTWTTSGIGGYNYQRYSNPVYDRLVAQAVVEPDRGKALVLWRRATDVINTDAPAVWLVAPVSVGAVSTRFSNVSFQPDQWAQNLWRWQLAGASPQR